MPESRRAGQLILATLEAAVKNPGIIDVLISGVARHPEFIGTAIEAAISAIL